MISNRLTVLVLVIASLMTAAAVFPAAANPIYASNGLGMFVDDLPGRPASMGGAGVANADGKNMLRDNPALLSAFTIHSYSFGASHVKSSVSADMVDDADIAQTRAEVLKLVIPLWRGLTLGWGISPLTRTDSIIEYSYGDYTDRTTFKGGINVSSLSIAGSFRNIVRLGISYNYNFGMIEESWDREFESDEFDDSTDTIKKKYKGNGFTVCAVARVWGNTSVGIGYTGKTDLDVTVRVRPGQFSYPEKTFSTRNRSLPARWRLGVTSVFMRRFTASADLSLANWEDIAKTQEERDMFTNTYRVGAGIRYAPAQFTGIPYYRKLAISAGFKFGTMYYKSYPTIDTVTEKAVTFGLEFPFLENVASLITSFEYGTRGVKNDNGWDESYSRIGLLLIGTIK